MLRCDIKVKTILSVWCFELFVNDFVLKREQKGEGKNVTKQSLCFFQPIKVCQDVDATMWLKKSKMFPLCNSP
jgi:hypothetical protein